MAINIHVESISYLQKVKYWRKFINRDSLIYCQRHADKNHRAVFPTSLHRFSPIDLRPTEAKYNKISFWWTFILYSVIFINQRLKLKNWDQFSISIINNMMPMILKPLPSRRSKIKRVLLAVLLLLISPQYDYPGGRLSATPDAMPILCIPMSCQGIICYWRAIWEIFE